MKLFQMLFLATTHVKTVKRTPQGQKQERSSTPQPRQAGSAASTLAGAHHKTSKDEAIAARQVVLQTLKSPTLLLSH